MHPFLRRLVSATVAAVAVLAATPAWSSSFVAMSGEDLVAGSAAVVEATVTAVRSAWNEDRTAIHTYSELRVDRVIHGEAPSTVTVRTPGGEVGGVRVEALGFPELRRAQRVLLFLHLGTDGTARITGHRQGQYTVVPGPRGEAMAISAQRDDAHLVAPGERGDRLPAVLPLAELESRVRALGRAARPDRKPPAR